MSRGSEFVPSPEIRSGRQPEMLGKVSWSDGPGFAGTAREDEPEERRWQEPKQAGGEPDEGPWKGIGAVGRQRRQPGPHDVGGGLPGEFRRRQVLPGTPGGLPLGLPPGIPMGTKADAPEESRRESRPEGRAGTIRSLGSVQK